MSLLTDDPKTRPSQLVYGPSNPMFTLTWRGHSISDRRPSMDLPFVPGRCQRCGKGGLRFVHLMECINYPHRVEVGSECARFLCPSYDPDKAERRLQTRVKRFKDWESSPDWWTSLIGNHYLIGPTYQAGVVASFPGYRWFILGRVKIWSKAIYGSHAEGMEALHGYLDFHGMLEQVHPTLDSFGLVEALQQLDEICGGWSDLFVRKSEFYYLSNVSTRIGKATCSIYTNDFYSPFWDLFLLLPDKELGTKRFAGPKNVCQSAVEGKIEALHIFRTEMTRLAYEFAGLTPEPASPRPTMVERLQLAEAHERAEIDHKAQQKAELACHAEKRQRLVEAHQAWEREQQAALERLARIEEVKSGIRCNTQRMHPAQYTTWRESSKGNLTCFIDCGYFDSGGTIFLSAKSSRYRFVIHMPRIQQSFSTQSYETEPEALEAFYKAYRDLTLRVLQEFPVEQWVYPTWQNFIETGQKPKNLEEVVEG